MLGPQADLTYPYTHFGGDTDALKKALQGGEGGVLEKLKSAQRPAVLVGPGVLHREDRDAVLKQARPSLHPLNASATNWGGICQNSCASSCVQSERCSQTLRSKGIIPLIIAILYGCEGITPT